MLRTCLFACLVLLTLAAPAQATTHYVLSGASGGGSSWANASGDLASTLGRARPGDEVWVGSGTFTPTTCTPCSRADRLVTFVLPKGVRLRGGFVGTETGSAQRTNLALPTVLSGRISGAEAGATQSFTILTVVDPTRGTTIDRIRFEGGDATETQHGLSDPIVSGAQLDVRFGTESETSALTVVDCAFAKAVSGGFGGAVFVDCDDDARSEVLFRECSFEGNTSAVGGGAVYLSAQRGGRDFSRFEGCSFRQNTAGGEGGGAIYWSGTDRGTVSGTIAECVFFGNRTVAGSGGAGGAVRVYAGRGQASVAVAKTVFEGNEAAFGGAVDFDVRFGGRGEPSFREVTFVGNVGLSAGGAFHLNTNAGGSSDPSFERCVFRGNRCEESGGALYFNAFEGRSAPSLSNCLIEQNTTRLYGGGMYCFGRGGDLRPTLVNTVIAKNSASSAGGIYALGSQGGNASATILNCAFVNNKALVGGALYSNANDEQGHAKPYVLNTIFQGNRAATGHTLRNVYGRPTLAYCSFDSPDCEALRSGLGAQQTCAEGNLFGVRDVFVDTATGDYRLRAGARVIDAGLGDTLLSLGVFYDLDSSARVRGGAVDIGPIELSADPLAWSLSALSRDSVACAGSVLELYAELTAPFPTTGVWSFGESRLATTGTLSVATQLSTAGRQTYVYTATAYGETLRDSVTVLVVPRRSTTLAVDNAALPDTLTVGRTYELLASAAPEETLKTLLWRDATGQIVATSARLDVEPTAPGVAQFTVEATFEGNCLDTTFREQTITVIARQLGTAVTNTLASAGIRLLSTPVQEVLRVSGLPAKPTTLRVFDATGRRLMSVATDMAPTAELPTAQLAPGVYFLFVTSTGGQSAGTFTKQ